MSKFVNPCWVITGPNTRWSYANVWEPRSVNGGAPKYSVSLIIPKSDTDTIEKINQAIRAAYEEGQSRLRGSGKVVPALSDLKLPLRDGDRERAGDPVYEGCMFHQCQFHRRPGDRGCEPPAGPGAFRGLFRGLRPGQHYPLRL